MSYQLIGSTGFSAKIGVILPTYREAENIANIVEDIRALNLSSTILIIDDSSPDKTADIIKAKQTQTNNLILYVRPKKAGLGTAITDGFRFFLSIRDIPEYIITLDADYSHNPKAIPQLLSEMNETCAIVIGSRYCKGGKIIGWPFTRKVISRIANFIAQTSLGLKLHDCTSGFRCYSTDFLKSSIGNLNSHTYEIQIETLRQASLKGFNIKEAPITFVNRKRGKSKLTFNEMKGYLNYIFKAVFSQIKT